MPAILSKATANPYSFETLVARVLGFIDQNLTKASSPQFKGLTITQGPLILNGDLEINGKINEINSDISRIADTSLVLGVDNLLPFNQGQFAIHRSATTPDVYLGYTASDSQWSLFDGLTTGSIAHFANLVDNTSANFNNFPLFLDAPTGSLVPSSTFKVPLTFQQSVTFPSGFATSINVGIDTKFQWLNPQASYLGLNLVDNSIVELRNTSRLSLQDGCDLQLGSNSLISLNPQQDGSGTSITLSSQVASLASAAQTGGVDLVVDTGAASTGGTLLVQSTLDTPDRSSVTIQGGQYINRGLTFGPADMLGANAPRLYTLQCPTINTLEFFGKEFTISPSTSGTNPIESAEVNLTGTAPALRLSTDLNETCVNLQVDSTLTTAASTVFRLNALTRPSGTPAPLNLVVDAEESQFNGNMEIDGDFSVGGTLTQSNGILSPSVAMTNLFNTDNVYVRTVAMSTPSTRWCQIILTTELTPNIAVNDSVPFGFDFVLPNRMTNFQYIGDVYIQSKALAYDPNTKAGKDAEITAIPLLGSTTVRITIEADETLAHTVQLCILYQTI